MRLLMLLLVLSSLLAFGQKAETCKHCPVDLDQQFPEAPHQHGKVFNTNFFIAEGLTATAISVDSFLTIKYEGKRCLEGSNGFPERVSGKELAVDGAVQFGATFVLTALLKYADPPKHFKWTPYLIPAYGTALHAHGAYQWYTQCR